jgi:MMP 1-O-methyltransferase
MRDEAVRTATEAKGFLSESEGRKLFDLALEASLLGPCLEIGGYCGKSAVFLAEGCRLGGRNPLLSIDHHRGSAEQQPGEPYFDPELFDAGTRTVNTLPEFQRTIRRAGLLDWVIPVVGESVRVSRCWGESRSLGLVFIDGGHGILDVLADFGEWSGRVCTGGYLCFHDVIPDPEKGGQSPNRVFEHARGLEIWKYEGLFETLGVLRRL